MNTDELRRTIKFHFGSKKDQESMTKSELEVHDRFTTTLRNRVKKEMRDFRDEDDEPPSEKNSQPPKKVAKTSSQKVGTGKSVF